MTDVSHELGALRFVVESPLSSKVAMFNNQATQHKQSQLLNPFSHDGRASSPKPTFSKDQYGKPLAGSLTEMRGQKANMHVMKEMLELCQIISSEGYQVKDEPTMRVIPFGELFNIYNYISDKVVGILLRARKHKLLDFEGEMLYQRRDDDVPIFLLRPVSDIRAELNAKIDEIKRGTSPAPQSTSVLLDKSAQEQNLKVKADQRRMASSRTPSPSVKPKPKSPTPTETTEKPAEPIVVVPAATVAEAPVSPVAAPIVVVDQPNEPAAPAAVESSIPSADKIEQVQTTSDPQPEGLPAPLPETNNAVTAEVPVAVAIAVAESAPVKEELTVAASGETVLTAVVETTIGAPAEPIVPAVDTTAVAVVAEDIAANDVIPESEPVAPIQPVNDTSSELPTIVIEASATFVRTVSVDNVDEKLDTDAAAVTTAESA